MRLQIAAIAREIDLSARTAGKSGLLQRLAQRRAIAVTARVDLGVGKQTAERTAADERTEMAFFVSPCRDIDAVAERACDLQAVDHAQRAVQPAGVRLRLDMTAEQQMRPRAARASDHVADAVDFRIEAGLGHARRKPVTRCDIIGRVGGPMHAGLVRPNPGERAKVAEQPVAVDVCCHGGGCHGAITIPCGRIIPSASKEAAPCPTAPTATWHDTARASGGRR